MTAQTTAPASVRRTPTPRDLPARVVLIVFGVAFVAAGLAGLIGAVLGP